MQSYNQDGFQKRIPYFISEDLLRLIFKQTACVPTFGRKYKYLVMPFGIINGPTIFVIMIYDLREFWNHLAITEKKLDIGENINTRIIIDDTFGHVITYQQGLDYLECIFEISKRYNLSWKLPKCHFFPDRAEFVGHDRLPNGNAPAKSKTPLLQKWPTPKIVRDISSFLGFANFYAEYIPFFEFRVMRLRQLCTLPYDKILTKEDLDEKAIKEMDDIKKINIVRPNPTKNR